MQVSVNLCKFTYSGNRFSIYVNYVQTETNFGILT